jgi:hypothetical protein
MLFNESEYNEQTISTQKSPRKVKSISRITNNTMMINLNKPVLS